VGFDTNELKPTYKIIWGTPGSSMAIEIFKILSSKMALSHDIAINASKLMDNKNISYETLLQKVTQKQIELDKTMSSMKKIEHDLKNQKGSMEGILQLKMNEELGKTKKELEKIISQAKDLFFQIKNEEIQKIKKIEEKEFSLKKQLSSVVKNEIHPISHDIPRESLNFKTLKSGDEVFSHEFKKNFRVLSIDFKKEEVTIGKGSFKISVAASTLSKPTHKEQKSKVQVFYSKSESSTVEIDARGMRLSEFQSLVDKSLGDLLSGDIPFLSIIHGHGDGILKNWLRDHLKKSSDFKGETPESGNDGETKITLK
jgi:DNA mismatch repair protein MutS2